MQHRILEISQESLFLRKYRGFIVIESKGEELSQVPIDDIICLLCNSPALTLTNQVINALAERGTPIVFCGTNHNPLSIAWPVESHHQQQFRMSLQLTVKEPLYKKLWALIIKNKIKNQANVLEHLSKQFTKLKKLAEEVKSGDKNNLESYASKIYWQELFGLNFVRDRNEPTINSMLNYGYTIVRSMVARAVMSCGLHPTMGIHHHNRFNPMCLVDDLMEPFRPIIDLCVYKLHANCHNHVTDYVKKYLAQIAILDLESHKGASSVNNCIIYLVNSLVASLEKNSPSLILPETIVPIELPSPINLISEDYKLKQ